jgi:RNA polymerase sigma factor (sigma-70 family)
MDEEQLLQQSKEGHLGAFNALVEFHQVPVYNLAHRMLNDRGAAEDVTQDTFVSAFRNLNSFRSGNFRAWLMRIAANACRDYLRSARVRRNVSLDNLEAGQEFVLPAGSESLEASAMRRELSEGIQKGLDLLASDQRLAIILVDIQGLSYDETAQIVRAPIGTVKSRLSRARMAMRDYLLSNRELLPGDVRL